jgi:hypothetical protein
MDWARQANAHGLRRLFTTEELVVWIVDEVPRSVSRNFLLTPLPVLV